MKNSFYAPVRTKPEIFTIHNTWRDLFVVKVSGLVLVGASNALFLGKI
jgi:hypothetical protein